jgi:hypothetical protein
MSIYVVSLELQHADGCTPSANSGKGWRQNTTMPLSQNCPTVRSSLGVILIK